MRIRHLAVLGAIGPVALACAARPAPPPTEPASPAPPSGYSQSPAEPGASSTAEAKDEDRKQSSADDLGFTSLAEAEAALDQANAELNPSVRADKAAETKAKRPRDVPPAKPAATATPQGGAPDRCVNACKAFASLKRAAAAVCRLAGDSDARCKRAQTIVHENEARVAVCKCTGTGE